MYVQLLCLPGVVKLNHAADSLHALHDSVMWVFLSCGPQACDLDTERKQIYTLISEREALKAKIAVAKQSTLGLVSVVSKTGQLLVPLPPAGSAEEIDALKRISVDDAARLEAVRAELARLIALWVEPGLHCSTVILILTCVITQAINTPGEFIVKLPWKTRTTAEWKTSATPPSSLRGSLRVTGSLTLATCTWRV